MTDEPTLEFFHSSYVPGIGKVFGILLLEQQAEKAFKAYWVLYRSDISEGKFEELHFEKAFISNIPDQQITVGGLLEWARIRMQTLVDWKTHSKISSPISKISKEVFLLDATQSKSLYVTLVDLEKKIGEAIEIDTSIFKDSRAKPFGVSR